MVYCLKMLGAQSLIYVHFSMEFNKGLWMLKILKNSKVSYANNTPNCPSHTTIEIT